MIGKYGVCIFLHRMMHSHTCQHCSYQQKSQTQFPTFAAGDTKRMNIDMDFKITLTKIEKPTTPLGHSSPISAALSLKSAAIPVGGLYLRLF